MTQRRETVSRFSLEVGFEPRRDGQEALRGAYQHLLPPLSRLVRLTPRMRLGEEAHDAGPCIGLKTGMRDGRGPGGDLRQGLVRSTG
jgi:hypothetical protein